MWWGSPKPTWNWVWQGISRITRKASTSAWAAKGSLGEMWGHYESDGCPGRRRQREGGIAECLLCLIFNCWDQPSGKTLPRPSYPYSWLTAEELFILSRHLVLLLPVGLSSACRSHWLQSVRDSFKVTVLQGCHLKTQVRGLSAITWDNCCTYCLQLPLLCWRSSRLHRMASIVVYNPWSSVVQGSLKMNWNPRKVI